jgi:glycosyltransferase involved in cell wall biosynthesis
MRIGYLVSQYPAPSHTFIRREIAALREHGLDIQTFSVRPPRPEEIMSEADQLDLDATAYILPAGLGKLFIGNLKWLLRRPGRYFSGLALALRHRNPGVKAFVYAVFYFLEGILLAENLKRRGVEHLHNHFANPASHVAMVASHLLGIPMSMTLHGLCDFDYPAGPLLDEKISACSFVACATQYGMAQAMRQSNPANWDRLLVVRCGIDLESLPTVKVSTQNPERPFRFVSVGRLSPEKGQLGLLSAFSRACGSGLDAELVLVGDGPDRTHIESCIERLGLTERVTMLGRLPEARTLEEIAKSDALVLSSFMEGLPVVLMEALALQVPTIAPTVAGIPELITHRESGMLFSAGDWNELTRCLVELANDEQLRVDIAVRGRRRVEQDFEIKRAVLPIAERLHSQASAPEQQTWIPQVAAVQPVEVV